VIIVILISSSNSVDAKAGLVELSKLFGSNPV
jgi:hypothetical protein